MRQWPRVRWERLKYLRWVLRHPLSFIHWGHYARTTGHHLSLEDQWAHREPWHRWPDVGKP